MKILRSAPEVRLIWICYIFLTISPFMSFSQGENDIPLNKNGYWEKIAEYPDYFINLGGPFEMDDHVAAASPKSIVKQGMHSKTNGAIEAIVQRSTDSGQTWKTIYKRSDGSWKSIDHPNTETIGFLVEIQYQTSLKPLLFYSKNGGDSFNKAFTVEKGGIIKGNHAVNISMFNGKHWAFTTFKDSSLNNITYVHITHNGGKSWQTKRFNMGQQSNNVYQVVMRSAQKISLFPLASTEGKTMISQDGGKTWTSYSDFPDKAYGWRRGITFVNTNTGYVGGRIMNGRGGIDSGLIYKTDDGGRHWKLVFEKSLPAPVGGIMDISFANPQQGIAIGDFGNIIRTNDGGETWIKDSLNFPKVNMNYPFGIYEKQLEMAISSGRDVIYHFHRTDTQRSTRPEEPGHAHKFSIYPNPASQILTVEWNGQETVDGILYDVNGKKVRQFSLKPRQKQTRKISNLQSGIYFLKILGKKIGRKIVILNNK